MTTIQPQSKNKEDQKFFGNERNADRAAKRRKTDCFKFGVLWFVGTQEEYDKL